jgi:hypothetical protein
LTVIDSLFDTNLKLFLYVRIFVIIIGITQIEVTENKQQHAYSNTHLFTNLHIAAFSGFCNRL